MNPTSSFSAVPPASWFPRFLAPVLGPVLGPVLDSLRRFSERRALQDMLTLRSDRLLADIGFSREDLQDQIEAAVGASQSLRETERRIQRELAGYSDGELQTIGLSRPDIRRVARERAQQAAGSGQAGQAGHRGRPRTDAAA